VTTLDLVKKKSYIKVQKKNNIITLLTFWRTKSIFSGGIALRQNIMDTISNEFSSTFSTIFSFVISQTKALHLSL